MEDSQVERILTNYQVMQSRYHPGIQLVGLKQAVEFLRSVISTKLHGL